MLKLQGAVLVCYTRLGLVGAWAKLGSACGRQGNNHQPQNIKNNKKKKKEEERKIFEDHTQRRHS